MCAVNLREQLSGLPGMEQLLPAIEGLAPAYLVGGAVRDLLRGEASADLDVAIDGDALATARALAERLGGEWVTHKRFGTATVRARGVALDLAGTRRERYEHPGSLPTVEPAGLAGDLGRRDFTVNAMAIALSGPALGTLHDPLGGSEDLEARRIRVLHERSFLDDPTRLLRALRYEARLGFSLDPATERLACAAGEAQAFATVSGARVRDELMDLLREPEMPVALARLRDLGLATALHPALDADPDLAAGAALGAAETGADPGLAALAALCCAAPDAVEEFVDRLSLSAGQRDSVMRAARRGAELAKALRTMQRPSDLHALLTSEPAESLALALGLGAPGEPVLRFLSELSTTRLEITGEDLTRAGVPPSPALGEALAGTLRRKLDGEVSGRDEELRVALDLARNQA